MVYCIYINSLSEPLSLHIDPEVWEKYFKGCKKGRKKKKKRKRFLTRPLATTQVYNSLVGFRRESIVYQLWCFDVWICGHGEGRNIGELC